MKEAIKILMKEHEDILDVVDILEEKCNLIKSGGEMDINFFENVIGFIKNYADKFHHAKEEDILFKELCKDSVQGNLHCNPVEQMLYEHDIGRNFVNGMKESLIEKNKRKLVENSLGYVQLIREHIFKEDNILYPMADNVIDLRTQNIMLKKFEEIQKDRKKEIIGYLTFVKKIGKDKK